MDYKREAFNQNIETFMQDGWQEEMKGYVGGRTRFAVSLFITVFLSAVSLKTPFPEAVIIACVILWMMFVVEDPKARFFVTTFAVIRRRLDRRVNGMFEASGINWSYSSRIFKRNSGRGIKDLMLFRRYGSVSRYNTLTGTLGGVPTDIFNINVTAGHGENQIRLFCGSLFVIPLDVPSDYYLSIVPEGYRPKARVVIHGKEIPRLFRSLEEKENVLDIRPGFTVHTNSEDMAERLIDKTISPLFRHSEEKDELCLEMLVIHNKKAYLFFPYSAHKPGRKYPFDTFWRKEIQAGDVWEDVQDIHRKEWIIRTLSKNAGVTPIQT